MQQQQQQHQLTTNPHVLHYQKLQEQQLLQYAQQLQQEEQQQSQDIQPPRQPQAPQILYHHHQQRPQHAPTYVTSTAQQTTLSPPVLVHPSLQHHQQQLPAIVSHATGNEASPLSSSSSSPINPRPYHTNRLPHRYYTADTGEKYATRHQAYGQSAAPARQPATVYGPPPPPSYSSQGAKHSKQVLYAPMRYINDRKLPYSSKTFPYPPSFISLTTTEKPIANFYSYDHKSAYNKMPDFFSHRNAKSLLDSYIPSWQVVKMLQQYQHQTSNSNQNLQTLATPYHRNFKRNANDLRKA